MPLRAVIGRVGDGRGENGADRAGAPGQIDGLYIFVVRADIADMRKGEGDDLRGVGRIGEDFLIAGHGRVETDLAHRLAVRADAKRLDDFARGQHQHAGASRRRPTRRFFLIHAHVRSIPKGPGREGR